MARATVSLPCPKCAVKLRAPAWAEGRKFHCHSCRCIVTVPPTGIAGAETARGRFTVIRSAEQTKG